MRILVCLVSMTIVLSQRAYALEDSTVNKIVQFPNRIFAKLSAKTSHLDDQLTRQTEKYLERMAKREKRLQQKLYKTDSTAARNLFAGTQEKYQQFEEQIKNKDSASARPLQGEYLANADSTKTALAFLQQHQNLVGNSPKVQGQLSVATQQFNQLQSTFQQTDQIKEFIRQRRQLLQDNLSRYEQSLGLDKYMAAYNQQVYYYSEQVREYKEMFNDPDKMMQKALVLLNKIPAFQSFLRTNGQLSALFGISPDYGSASGLIGLQTRDQVQQLLQGQIAAGGSSGMASFESSLSTAHQGLDQFKEKLGQLGGGSGDMDMPQFKPNPEKTHSFLKRIELGTNLQTTRTSYYFPTTTDIGLSVGYKLNGRSTIGVGGSYKIGWGRGINHIAVTSQGASLRSFLDVKIKGSFYLSGGMEYNYQQPITNLQQIRSLGSWTQSGLIGFSKMIAVPGKLVKKTKVQLLWDFLSYRQTPRTQAINFRVGYNF